MSHRSHPRLVLLVLVLFIGACGRPPAPTPGLIVVPLPTATPMPPPETTADKAAALVAAEAEAVRQQDIDALASLWLPDGVVVDANNTPADETDDRLWRGWEQIKYRYVVDVFPYIAAPTAMPRPQVPIPTVTVTGREAEVVVPGSDGRTPQDCWVLRRQDGGWRIASLTFNLTPRQ